ncbi:MAG: FkbM family methyltransferase [Bacteroidia bacterium]|nr:FkbM family methyltransferase [Bacteroidia bacterium]
MFDRENYINSPVEIEKELLLLLERDKVNTVFDVGACEAEDSIRYAKLFPNAKVYAFEPRPDNIEKGKSSIEKHKIKSVVLENLALSDREGKADFFLSEGQPKGTEDIKDWDFGNKSSSLLPPSEEMKKHTEWLQFKSKIEVNTQRLEVYVKQKGIRQIDFMHLDVQGAELIVLAGAGTFLHAIQMIWMEVEAVELYKGQPLKQEVEAFMTERGFVNVLDTVNQVSGDQLYVNKRFFSNEQINRVKTRTKRTGVLHRFISFFKRGA